MSLNSLAASTLCSNFLLLQLLFIAFLSGSFLLLASYFFGFFIAQRTYRCEDRFRAVMAESRAITDNCAAVNAASSREFTRLPFGLLLLHKDRFAFAFLFFLFSLRFE